VVGTGSTVVLEALFEAGDPRLLTEVLASDRAKALGDLALRWYQDRRPGLRRLLLDYLDQGLDRPHHQPLVKRVLKAAETADDRELLAHALVSADRLVPRRLRRRWSYERGPDGRWTSAPVEQLVPHGVPRGRAESQGTKSRFTYRTRRYLQRRLWRFFRKLGRRDPGGYVRALASALVRYEDDQLDTPEALLARWGLVHALHHHSPVLEQGRSGWTVAEGRDLADLDFAPMFPEAWALDPGAAIELLARARSRTIRLFAIHVLRTHHLDALRRLSLADLRLLLPSPHAEVRDFLAERIPALEGLERVSIVDWLRLLEIDNPIALPALAARFAESVDPARLDDAGCVALLLAPTAAVAELGLGWLRDRPIRSGLDLDLRLDVANAPVAAVRGEAARWLVSVLETSPFATALHVRALVDARHENVRAAALEWARRDPRLTEDVGLWGAMAETPYDDVRHALVAQLEALDGRLDPAAVRAVWVSTLLSLRRGSRVKARALRQLAQRVASHPEEAEVLLPLFAIALRSLRAPERRAGLAAVARAAFAEPSLAAALRRHVPELDLGAPA
jgi:hypothetical protein